MAEAPPPGCRAGLAGLAGLRVLLTRPASEAEESARAVRDAGGEALLAPGLELAPPEDREALGAALRERHDVIALTSLNAARAVLSAAGAEALAGAFVAVVGERTAAVLREAGARVDLVPTDRSAAGLFAALQAAAGTAAGTTDAAWRVSGEADPRRAGAAPALSGAPAASPLSGGAAALPPLQGLRVLFPRAAEGREELVTRLEGAGARVRTVVAYRMVAAPPSRMSEAVAALRAGAVDLVPFGSPRSAEPLLAALGPEAPALLGRCAVGAIGATTAAALRAAGVTVDVVAEGASFEQLIAQLAELRRARGAPPQAGR